MACSCQSTVCQCILNAVAPFTLLGDGSVADPWVLDLPPAPNGLQTLVPNGVVYDFSGAVVALTPSATMVTTQTVVVPVPAAGVPYVVKVIHHARAINPTQPAGLTPAKLQSQITIEGVIQPVAGQQEVAFTQNPGLEDARVPNQQVETVTPGAATITVDIDMACTFGVCDVMSQQLIVEVRTA
jgi:hypothetical protein